MATALFVFDHKYPCDENSNYYYSSGFDAEFFNRYYQIFDRFDIFGREKKVYHKEKLKKILYPSKFYLVESNKNLILAKDKMEKAIESVDCVIARMPSLLGSLAIYLAKKNKKPYIVEVVACTYDALINSVSWKRRILARPAEIFYRFILRNNPYTIYVTKEFLQKKYPCKGQKIACSNVTLPSVEKTALECRQRKNNKIAYKKCIKIGTCSTLNVDFKGQKYVIQALPKLVDMGYDIFYEMVGDGDGTWLLKIAKELGVENRVKIIGHLDHEEIFDWLDTIDLYVHSSCQEGLSRAIIEAMSRACPIVATDAGGVHELINKDYIVPVKSSIGIIKGINKIIEDGFNKVSLDNFENSKEYEMDRLYKRRKEFYYKFLKEARLR